MWAKGIALCFGGIIGAIMPIVDLMGLDTSTIQNPEMRVCDIVTEDKCWDIDKIRFLVKQEDIIKKNTWNTTASNGGMKFMLLGTYRLWPL